MKPCALVKLFPDVSRRSGICMTVLSQRSQLWCHLSIALPALLVKKRL